MNHHGGKPGGIVGEALRMNEQKQIVRRRKRLGPKVEVDMSIQARFERFNSANPEVYTGLVRLARKLRAQGFASYGIVGLYEVLRYDRSLSTDGKPFKLSNDFRSRYARLIMDQEADLKDFFKTRELTAL